MDIYLFRIEAVNRLMNLKMCPGIADNLTDMRHRQCTQPATHSIKKKIHKRQKKVNKLTK